MFTCEVRDYDQVVRGQVYLQVQHNPQVTVKPQAISVEKGQKANFRCFSQTPGFNSFSYQWLKVMDILEKIIRSDENVCPVLP